MSLPQISRNEAKALTTISQRGWSIPVRLRGTDWEADLRVATDLPPSPPSDWALTVEWAGLAIEVELSQAAADQMASELLDGTSLPELPPELAQSVLEAALSDVGDALEQLGRGRPRIQKMQPVGGAEVDAADSGVASDPATHPAYTLAVMLRASQGTRAISATLKLDRLGLLMLSGMLVNRPAHPGPLGEHTPLVLAAELGFTQLPAESVDSLGEGDVVLLDAFHAGPERLLWLTADGIAGLSVYLPETGSGSDADLNTERQRTYAPEIDPNPNTDFDDDEDADFDDDDEYGEMDDERDSDSDGPMHARLATATDDDDDAAALHASEPSLSQPEEAPAADVPSIRQRASLIVMQPWNPEMTSDAPSSSAASLGELPVRLSFSLGEVTLTLAELREVQPGHVLELNCPVHRSVQIRANGALVGEGELVEIDGQLGVSVSRLFASTASTQA